MRHLLFISSLLLLLPFSVLAQEIRQIRGQILNLHSRQPVSDISIQTEDGKSGTISNSAGRFILNIRMLSYYSI